MIDTVTFDLWNTLIHDTRENGETRTNLRLSKIYKTITSSNISIQREDLKRGYFECLEYCISVRKKGLDVSFADQICQFLELSKTGLYSELDDATIGRIENIYADVYLEHPSLIHSSSFEIIKDLKAKHIKLAIISNTSMTPGTTFRKFLFKNGLAQYFDALIFSDELRISKPNPDLFAYTLNKLSSAPEYTVHVGDQYQTDIVGAKAAGINSILIDPNPTAEDWDGIYPSLTYDSLKSLANNLNQMLSL